MRQILSPLDGIRSPFGRLMSSTAPFTPAVLFALAEPGVWYDPSDLTTLFQDTAGTTPVTTPGQTVALALDKSKGLVLGSELVTNGDFSAGGTGWSTTGAITFSGGGAVFGSGAAFLTQSGILTIGKVYRVTFTLVTSSAGNDAKFHSSVWSPEVNLSAAPISNNPGTYTLTLRAVTTNFRLDNYSGTGFTVDNISVKELPGFHATQGTTASCPIYGINPVGGRRNLLTFTEQFDNAAWTKTRSSITANAGTAPDGTTTADKLVEDSTPTNTHVTLQAPSGVVAGAYTATVYAKSVERSRVVISNEETSGSNGVYAVFNLGTGAIDVAATAFGTGFSGAAATITSVGNGWYRCSVSGSTSATTRRISINLDNATSGAISQTYSGNGTSGILIWGAQLETGSTATAYQRVSSIYDVTEAGVASVSYLFFDGTDDFLVTPTITPATDKAQVFAGVRKLSDAATNNLANFGQIFAGQSGSFYIDASEGANRLRIVARGTVQATATTTNAAYTAPVTGVYTTQIDIAGDTTSGRWNGTSALSSAGDLGTGNFTAQALYIGRYNGTSSPANMQLYSLIVRFGTNLTTDTITSTETWVAGKTGISI